MGIRETGYFTFTVIKLENIALINQNFIGSSKKNVSQ
jgi:hypothetical protein